ncbi:MAG: DUF134 domain-containing protein [Candidatus Competibacteraceae bacterium]|jgi:predicted DNA-binding protein (UPF0251 family)|nr:DUF134 domain-containing protein [Candidatus Competibacteraceae bacterium]
MPRNRKHRRCRPLGNERLLKPRGIPLTEAVLHWLAPDEFEAMRLCDGEGLSQIEAGERMHISRGTIQRLLETGRHKVIQALLNNQALGVSDEPAPADGLSRTVIEVPQLAEEVT